MVNSKKVIGRAGVDLFAMAQRGVEFVIADELAAALRADADAFVKADEMGDV